MSDEGETTGSPEGILEEPKWWLSKDSPMQGDVPEWMPSQFKSVEALATSYKELQKRFGQAPDHYDLTKGGGWVNPEYEGFKEMIELGQKYRVPGEFMDKMLESVGGYIDSHSFKPESVIEKLGEGADERLNLLENWGNSNFGEETFAALTENITTAEGVLALEKIREAMMNNQTVIPTDNGASSKPATIASLQNEMKENLSRYEKDPSYRADLMRRFDIASQAKSE